MEAKLTDMNVKDKKQTISQLFYYSEGRELNGAKKNHELREYCAQAMAQWVCFSHHSLVTNFKLQLF